MGIELGFASLAVLAATVAVVIFFCGIEMAPAIARKTARSARYEGLKNNTKLVRFW